MSAITIPDMLEIIRAHGLVPVPVDLDPLTLAPDPDSLKSGLTPRTVALLATHLFGARIPMDPLVSFAGRHGLVLLEDCAQAYWGDGYTGHPGSHVRLFSFGPSKYNTALGGGLLFVDDPVLRDRVRRLHNGYPEQSKGRFFMRLAKYGVVLLFSRPGPYTLLCAMCHLFGRSHDTVSYRAMRSFRGLEMLKKNPPSAVRRPLGATFEAHALERPGADRLPAGGHGVSPQGSGPLLPGPRGGTLLLALRCSGRQCCRPVPEALGSRFRRTSVAAVAMRGSVQSGISGPDVNLRDGPAAAPAVSSGVS